MHLPPDMLAAEYAANQRRIDAIKAKQSALEKDAARYRWLRNVATWKQATTLLNDAPQGIDAAIDAAISGTDAA